MAHFRNQKLPICRPKRLKFGTEKTPKYKKNHFKKATSNRKKMGKNHKKFQSVEQNDKKSDQSKYHFDSHFLMIL